MCQHTDPGMTLKHRDFDPFGLGRYSLPYQDGLEGELSMQVKGNIFATRLQPNEKKGLDAHWASHLPTCTPSVE